ncbi:biotin/lipoyl-containing protein [Herbidospora mongoliensis]|uniref:biotin/lipoyl-containing protein n=1 Tax=Herbidospora mongoliensis TaxID=688067 RepID=UPI0008376E07|nr:biotin/lipoyl-containing protein [Herbidospora mongoliensis]
MKRHFKLPYMGEDMTEVEIVRWHVAVGDRVEVNQIIVEIETAKASVELPSPYEGRVAAILTGEGETVEAGDVIITIETDVVA